jgi:hypothetical protein
MLPSQCIIPIFNFLPEEMDLKISSRQGIGWHFGSVNHGSAAITVLVKSVKVAGERHIGPMTEGIVSCPSMELRILW